MSSLEEIKSISLQDEDLRNRKEETNQRGILKEALE